MILTLASSLLIISVLLALLRMIFTKDEVDRVIAVDVLAFQLLALSVLLAFHDGKPLALQFAFALSLLGFISTLILSRFLKNPTPTSSS